MPRTRRRMVRFRIDEVSLVDVPANKHALAVLLKRGNDTDSDAVAAFRKQYVTIPAIPDSPELEALAKRVIAAMDRRDRELEETTIMPAVDNTDIIAKRVAAQQSMNEYVNKRAVGQSRYSAMENWRKQNPIAFAQLQAISPAAPAPIAKASEHRQFFGLLVDEIRKSRGVDRCTAMEIARVENRAAFERMQNA